jgi:hypothetical protein
MRMTEYSDVCTAYMRRLNDFSIFPAHPISVTMRQKRGMPPDLYYLLAQQAVRVKIVVSCDNVTFACRHITDRLRVVDHIAEMEQHIYRFDKLINRAEVFHFPMRVADY